MPKMAMLAVLIVVLALLVDASPGTVVMKMHKGFPSPDGTITKRAAPLSVTLGNVEQEGFYYLNMSIGTPAQALNLIVDTGSSDLWMFGPKSCNISTSHCLGGAYDSSKSTSANVLKNAPDFEIRYDTPGSGVYGFYVEDTVHLGPASMTSVTMAQATYAGHVPAGIIGIGFDTRESYVNNQGGSPYPNILDVMVNQSVINTRAFSLYLDDLASTTGTILFGGYDTAKYSGSLTPLQMQPDAETGEIDEYSVVLSAMAVTTSKGTQSVASTYFPLAGVLDSGTSATRLPQALFNILAQAFGATPIDGTGPGYLVNCSLAKESITIDYQFGGTGGPIIQVPVEEVVVPIIDPKTGKQISQNNVPLCQFGILPAPANGDILLGDTMLRSAYVVYDLDLETIWIAQTKFDTTSSNIQAIGANGLAVASSATFSPVSVSSSATGPSPPSLPPGTTLKSSITGSPVFSSASTVAGLASSAQTGAGASAGAGGLVISSTASAPTVAAASTAAAAATSKSAATASTSAFWRPYAYTFGSDAQVALVITLTLALTVGYAAGL